MVKFDIKVFEFLKSEHFRVLIAVEMGMKNHAIVPTSLIESIARQKRGNCFKIINDLHKHKLVVHDSIPYDGYRLTFRGYDFLAIRTLVKRGVLSGIGRQIGVGKESDVYEAYDSRTDPATVNVIKLHRLGTTAFHNVRQKRDYLGKRTSASNWLYMSRLSALKEYAFMEVLHKRRFPVPTPIDVSRHAVLMSKVHRAFPLIQVKRIAKPEILYTKSMALIVKLAKHGLIHCDFNEFNLMVDTRYNLTLIDFPQTVSIHHPNAIEYFNRDVKCIRDYFFRKFGFFTDEYPVIDEHWAKAEVHTHLDTAVEASGHFQPTEDGDFEQLIGEYRANVGAAADHSGDDDSAVVEEACESEEEVKHEVSDIRMTDESLVAASVCTVAETEISAHKSEEKLDASVSSDVTAAVVTDLFAAAEAESDSMSDEGEIDSAEERAAEKRRYEEQRTKRRAKFEKRRRLKRQLATEMAKAKGHTDVHSHVDCTPSGKRSRPMLSDEEIKRRVKKKAKDEERRHALKKTRKTGDKQRATEQMRRDIRTGGAAFWG